MQVVQGEPPRGVLTCNLLLMYVNMQYKYVYPKTLLWLTSYMQVRLTRGIAGSCLCPTSFKFIIQPSYMSNILQGFSSPPLGYSDPHIPPQQPFSYFSFFLSFFFYFSYYEKFCQGFYFSFLPFFCVLISEDTLYMSDSHR